VLINQLITGGPHSVILIEINVTEKMPIHVNPMKKHGPFRVNWRDLPYMAYLSGLGDMPPRIWPFGKFRWWRLSITCFNQLLDPPKRFRQIVMEMDLLNWHGLMGCSRPWGVSWGYVPLWNINTYESVSCPYAPWCWYIYLHLGDF